MAEILFFIEDKGPEVDTFKVGDVIDVHPDGWPWTQEELTRDNWRIIRVDVLASTIFAILNRVTIPAPGQKAKIRDYYIDPAQLPNPSLFTGPRTLGIVALTRKQCTDAIVKK